MYWRYLGSREFRSKKSLYSTETIEQERVKYE